MTFRDQTKLWTNLRPEEKQRVITDDIAPHLGVKNEMELNRREVERSALPVYIYMYMRDDYNYIKTKREIKQFSSIASNLGHEDFLYLFFI